MESRTFSAGWLIFAMMCLSVLGDVGRHVVGAEVYFLAGVCGWLGALLLLDRIDKFQRAQAAAIGIAGLVLMWFAQRTGGEAGLASAISKNTSLITMIASVGFLRLIALSDVSHQTLPKGPAAYFKTLVGISVFGSIINLSAPVLFADRLFAEGRLNRLASSSITRVFSGCSAWSPFFGGMAAVITYVPDIDLAKVIMVCLPFALIGLLMVCTEAFIFKRAQLQEFYGYPVRFASLWIPLSLSLLVVTLSYLQPEWSILSCISLSAVFLTVVVLAVKLGTRCPEMLVAHIHNQLPRMINELLLFLVAGLLAEGLARFIATGQVDLPSFGFTAGHALALIAAIIVMGIVGVHPLVTVAGLTPMILTINPNPNLLAVAYLFAWSLGTSASPLSGTHLVFQGRYAIASWRGAVWNWPYVAVMFLVALPYLFFVQHLL